MQIDNDIKLDFNDVLIKPKRSTLNSRSEVSLERTFKFKHSSHTWTGTPIISSNMDSSGTFEMFHALKKHKMMTCLHKHYSAAELIDFYNNITEEESNYVWYSLGIGAKDELKYEEVKKSVNKEIKFVCLDVPSAYIEKFVDFVEDFRDRNLNTVIMAGNAVTGEITEELILKGADVVKCGIGSGASCSTRIVAGVGVPQLSAIIETSDHAHGLKGHVCSDGGIVYPADLGKAFGANADFVMMGGVLAGHIESGGDWIVNTDRLYFENESNEIYLLVEGESLTDREFNQLDDAQYEFISKRVYGMSSTTAQEKYYGGKEDYRASEGREHVVPYKGNVDDTVRQYLGGLRSTLTYVGAATLKELSKRTTFIRVNRTINTDLYGMGKL